MSLYSDFPSDTLENSLGRAAQIKSVLALAHDVLLVGSVPTQPLPWNSPDFQRAILEEAKKLRQWKKDSEDLAVIRSVFGGNK